MNTIRKCVTISKTNKLYVDKLVKQKKAKNFSRYINDAVDERREKDERVGKC